LVVDQRDVAGEQHVGSIRRLSLAIQNLAFLQLQPLRRTCGGIGKGVREHGGERRELAACLPQSFPLERDPRLIVIEDQSAEHIPGDPTDARILGHDHARTARLAAGEQRLLTEQSAWFLDVLKRQKLTQCVRGDHLNRAGQEHEGIALPLTFADKHFSGRDVLFHHRIGERTHALFCGRPKYLLKGVANQLPG
jgi:hypothetical protein